MAHLRKQKKLSVVTQYRSEIKENRCQNKEKNQLLKEQKKKLLSQIQGPEASRAKSSKSYPTAGQPEQQLKGRSDESNTKVRYKRMQYLLRINKKLIFKNQIIKAIKLI